VKITDFAFPKISAIFVNFRSEIFAKTKINFRENEKTKIFVSTLFGTARETSEQRHK
jgi:hypothetical protein